MQVGIGDGNGAILVITTSGGCPRPTTARGPARRYSSTAVFAANAPGNDQPNLPGAPRLRPVAQVFAAPTACPRCLLAGTVYGRHHPAL